MDLDGLINNSIKNLQLAYYFTLTSHNHLIHDLSISIHVIHIQSHVQNQIRKT
jgi:hypothetical protein